MSTKIDEEPRLPGIYNFHLFESLPDGSYKCIGQTAPYTGNILWKGTIVGEWKDGKIVRLKAPSQGN